MRESSTVPVWPSPARSHGPTDGDSFYSLTDAFCTVFRGQTYTFTVRAPDLSGNLSPAGAPLTITIP